MNSSGSQLPLNEVGKPCAISSEDAAQDGEIMPSQIGGMCAEPGVLYCVAVPIGNLGDFTKRSLAILASVSVIASEEVQSTRRLLASQGLHARLISYREAGREEASQVIVDYLQKGESVALVSGAGTPAVSDPGRQLVEQCHQLGIRVVPVAGVSALTAAISAAGLPCRRFSFEGFLPRQQADCFEYLRTVANQKRTLVWFEAPHRLAKSIQWLLEVLGPRRAFLGRELTKKFEECRLTDLAQLAADCQAEPLRGECVLVVEGARTESTQVKEAEQQTLLSDVDFLLERGISAKTAADILGHFRGTPRNVAKKLLMSR